MLILLSNLAHMLISLSNLAHKLIVLCNLAHMLILLSNLADMLILLSNLAHMLILFSKLDLTTFRFLLWNPSLAGMVGWVIVLRIPAPSHAHTMILWYGMCPRWFCFQFYQGLQLQPCGRSSLLHFFLLYQQAKSIKWNHKNPC